MDAQDLFPALDVGVRDLHLPVEPAGRSRAGSSTSGRLVAATMMMPSFASNPSISTESWFSVCSRSSLPPPSHPARAADRVDFVDEDDAGACLLGLLEHVAHTGCTDTDEHFHEVRARDGEEGHTRLARDRAGKQGFCRARRADQQRAFRNLAAETAELLRVAQEFDDSSSSSLASSMPATSSNVTRPCFLVNSLARDFPNPIAPPRPPPCIRFMK